MIVESSAFVSILRNESDGNRLVSAIRESKDLCRMSAASFFEACIVIDSKGDAILSERVEALLRELDIVIEPVKPAHALIARNAYRTYGKGSGHRASLNFGDCFSYALAKELGESLLFVGNDFTETDLYIAEY